MAGGEDDFGERGDGEVVAGAAGQDAVVVEVERVVCGGPKPTWVAAVAKTLATAARTSSPPFAIAQATMRYARVACVDSSSAVVRRAWATAGW